MCEHKWIYQMSDYKCEKVGYYAYEYMRVDTYYCEKGAYALFCFTYNK